MLSEAEECNCGIKKMTMKGTWKERDQFLYQPISSFESIKSHHYVLVNNWFITTYQRKSPPHNRSPAFSCKYFAILYLMSQFLPSVSPL